MATTYSLAASVGGGVRNGIFPILTTSTVLPGAGDIYKDVFSTAQNASGVGVVSVTLQSLSTASCTVYSTNSPDSAIAAGTALWSVVGSAVTGSAAGTGTNVVITGPITALTVAVGTALAGNQATISIHAGFPAGKPASY
jgi:hypothetical protein